ncbi:MAG: hypothetical protein Kow0067_13600 [Coriobacteriia bacterium]
MRRARGHTIILTAGLGLLAVLVVAGLLLVVNAETGWAGCTLTAPAGWLAPIIAASIIGGVAWALLGQEPRDRDHMDVNHDACPACGRSVLGQWRMCPYCGEMLGR